jgi:CRP-like cAMP-binding protein
MAHLGDHDRQVFEESLVFRGLRRPDLSHIEARGLVIEARESELLLAEQSRGPGLYLVLDGQVEVYLPERISGGLHRRSPLRLNVLGPGRCFGEYSLIDADLTSAAARALTRVRLFFLSREEFWQITNWDPHVGQAIFRNMLRFLVSRLRAKDRELDVVLLRDEKGPVRG